MSGYQKGKTNLDFTEAKETVSEWQWHQLDHMQVLLILLLGEQSHPAKMITDDK